MEGAHLGFRAEACMPCQAFRLNRSCLYTSPLIRIVGFSVGVAETRPRWRILHSQLFFGRIFKEPSDQLLHASMFSTGSRNVFIPIFKELCPLASSVSFVEPLLIANVLIFCNAL